MGTLVCFHAHPDDEPVTTGGTIVRAKIGGHRVVLVVATNGDHGEVPDDLGPGETLVDRRRKETARSAELLGIDRVEWLGYSDSGMTGWEQNADPASFHQAPVDEAAAKLAAILREEGADVLVTYDWHGNYGHPDHIKVHVVGHRAAERAGVPEVYEATMNHDHFDRLIASAEESGLDFGVDGDFETDDGVEFGMREDTINTAVDVTAHIDLKRAAVAAHASQVTDTGFFLSMPVEAFTAAFGTEWFIHCGEPGGIREDWLAGLPLPATPPF